MTARIPAAREPSDTLSVPHLGSATQGSSGVETALLDRHGVIVAVNEAWERFALVNGGEPRLTGVGVSYLAVCESAAEDVGAEAVAEAVRSAIRGDLPAPMTVRIPCHAPAEQRFFDVLISSRTDRDGECLGATVTLSPVSDHAAPPPEDPAAAEQSHLPEPTTPGHAGCPETRGAVDAPELTFPDEPRLELEQLLGQLTVQAQSVMSTQGRLRALLRANAVVTSDLSLPVVLRHIVEAARELVDARYAALGVIADDGTLSEFLHSGMDAETADPIGALPRGEGLLGLLITDPRPVRLPDLHEHQAATGFPSHHPPMRSFLGVPIRVRDQVFGNLYLTDSARGEFTHEDEQLILSLAASAGVAIENARLFTQAAQQRQWLESSTELTQRLFAGATEDPLTLVLRHATQGAAADFGRVVVPVDEQHGQVRAQIGTMGDLLEGQMLNLENTLCGRILHEVKPLLVTDYDREFAGSPQDPKVPTGVGAVAGVPLLAPDGEVLGALVVRRPPAATPFDAHDLGLLESFAMHAGLAVALDRARADREALLMLAEHDRIAADLHDHVIQELFAIGMGLHGMVHPHNAPAHNQRLIGYVESLDQTVRRIRTTIFQLTHRPSGRSSLRARLMAVLDEERPALGCSADIDFSGSLDLGVPDALGDDVLAVLREALSNVARHAEASTVSVRVSLSGSLVEIEVTDDGVGLSDSTRSSGLANLRRRAESHGGTFRIWSPPTGGTRLHWTASVAPPTPIRT